MANSGADLTLTQAGIITKTKHSPHPSNYNPDDVEWAVEFEEVYATPPVVVVSEEWHGAIEPWRPLWLKEVKTTGFRVATTSGDENGNYKIHWIAIGCKPE